MEHRIDLQHAHAIVSRMAIPQHAAVLRRECTAGQILTPMRRFEFAVGMRLHVLIIAALAGVPFVPLPYASRVGGLARELGVPALPVQQFNAGQLIAFVDNSQDHRHHLRRRIQERLPGPAERARRTADPAVDLLETARCERFAAS